MLPEIKVELTEEQKEELTRARALIPKLEEQIRRAELAGLDMTQQKADLAQRKVELEKLYKVYVRKITGTRPA